MKKDLIPVIIAYVLALTAASALLMALPYGLIFNALIATIIATIIIFCFSRAYKNSSFYDAYWSVFPPFIAVFWLMSQGALEEQSLRALIVTGLVMWWAIRLTLNWAGHWHGLSEEDWRYQPIRDQAGKYELLADFGGTHMFPTLIVFTALLPLHAAINVSDAPLNYLDYAAIIVTAGAILIETIADLQLHKFNTTKKPGEIIKTGLWRYSRHPNYFGEWGFWAGLALFGLAAYPQGWWWFTPGVIAMGCMFAFASIPMMDQRGLERRKGYADYMKTTSAFIPWPPK